MGFVPVLKVNDKYCVLGELLPNKNILIYGVSRQMNPQYRIKLEKEEIPEDFINSCNQLVMKLNELYDILRLIHNEETSFVIRMNKIFETIFPILDQKYSNKFEPILLPEQRIEFVFDQTMDEGFMIDIANDNLTGNF